MFKTSDKGKDFIRKVMKNWKMKLAAGGLLYIDLGNGCTVSAMFGGSCYSTSSITGLRCCCYSRVFAKGD